MIFLNFKNYQESSGDRGVLLLKIIEEINASGPVKVIPVVGALDLAVFKQSFAGEIWLQSVDVFEYGASTGKLNALGVKQLGAMGVFVNHSENKFIDGSIADHVKSINQSGLKSLVFAADIDELSQVVQSNADFISYEPPELVGSKEASVSNSKPDVISAAVSMVGQTPLIVGAGVKSMSDVKVALELGAKGIAVASSVILSPDPKSVLLDLIEGFK